MKDKFYLIDLIFHIFLKKKQMNELIIEITASEWLKLISPLIKSGGKLKIGCQINYFLTHKLHENEIYCDLKNIFNWIKKENSRKRNCVYWNAKFKCKNCSKDFYAFIDKFVQGNLEIDQLDDVIININYDPLSADSVCLKPQKIKQMQCRGIEREQIGMQLLASSTSEVKSKHTIFNYILPLNEKYNGKNYLKKPLDSKYILKKKL